MSTRKPSYQAEQILRAVERMDEQAAENAREIVDLRDRLKSAQGDLAAETKRADEAERAIMALAKAGPDANLIRENGMTLDTATRCGVRDVYLSRGYVAATNAVWQRFADVLADPLVVGLMALDGLETQAPEVPQ